MTSTPSILGVPLDSEEPPVKKEKTSDELQGSIGAGVMPAVAIKTEPPEYEPGEEPGSPIGSVKSESEYYEEVREPSSPTPAVKIEPPDVMNQDSIHLMDTELPVPEGMEQPSETAVTIKTEPQDPTEGGVPELSMETGRRSNGEVEKTKRPASLSVPNASAKRRKLKPRASSVQIDTLIALMEERQALAKPSYEFSGGSIGEERTLWWSQLVERLNALGPATKSRSEWKHFWSGRVRVVREKLAQGAGSAPLTQQDKRIVALLGADTAGECGGPLLGFGAQSPAEDSSADSRGTAAAGASTWMYEVEQLESLADGQDAEAVPHRRSRNSNRRAAHSGEESGRLLVEYQAQLVAQVARLTEAVLEDTRIRRQQVEVWMLQLSRGSSPSWSPSFPAASERCWCSSRSGRPPPAPTERSRPTSSTSTRWSSTASGRSPWCRRSPSWRSNPAPSWSRPSSCRRSPPVPSHRRPRWLAWRRSWRHCARRCRWSTGRSRRRRTGSARSSRASRSSWKRTRSGAWKRRTSRGPCGATRPSRRRSRSGSRADRAATTWSARWASPCRPSARCSATCKAASSRRRS
ncbi:unnamed protein product [Ixodes pacificus]